MKFLPHSEAPRAVRGADGARPSKKPQVRNYVLQGHVLKPAAQVEILATFGGVGRRARRNCGGMRPAGRLRRRSTCIATAARICRSTPIVRSRRHAARRCNAHSVRISRGQLPARTCRRPLRRPTATSSSTTHKKGPTPSRRRALGMEPRLATRLQDASEHGLRANDGLRAAAGCGRARGGFSPANWQEFQLVGAQVEILATFGGSGRRSRRGRRAPFAKTAGQKLCAARSCFEACRIS